jgi:plastocyanin
LVAVTLAGASLLSACGGSGGGGGGGNAPKGKAVTVKAGLPLAVTARDYSYSPSSVVVTGAAAGGSTPVKISLDNKGVQGGTGVFTGGQKQSATVKLEPGTYSMICSVANHEQLGMKATLVVKTGR